MSRLIPLQPARFMVQSAAILLYHHHHYYCYYYFYHYYNYIPRPCSNSSSRSSKANISFFCAISESRLQLLRHDHEHSWQRSCRYSNNIDTEGKEGGGRGRDENPFLNCLKKWYVRSQTDGRTDTRVHWICFSFHIPK